jgi:c-di-GMP-binding flagellar brake protein YcgR
MGKQERRKFKRAYIKIPVECRSKNFWQYVEARDISAGGMFVATEQLEPIKTKLELMFELAEEEKKYFRAEALVVWTRQEPVADKNGNLQPVGMGLMFTDLIPITAKEYIDRLVIKIGSDGNKSPAF